MPSRTAGLVITSLVSKQLQSDLPSPGVIFSIFILSVYRNGLEDSIESKISKKLNREAGGKTAEPYPMRLCVSSVAVGFGRSWGAQNVTNFGLIMRNSRGRFQRIWIIEVTNAVQYR